MPSDRIFLPPGGNNHLMINNVTVILVVRDTCKINTTSLYCPGEEGIFVTVFAGVDGMVCSAIEMSSATQNWLKMTNG